MITVTIDSPDGREGGSGHLKPSVLPTDDGGREVAAVTSREPLGQGKFEGMAIV